MDEIPRFFRHGGGWGNISGPGQFMFRLMISGGVASVMTGMTAATLGAILMDTASLPFLFGACTGYIIGAVGFYRDSLRKSLNALDRYPRLLQIHLDANFSHRGFDRYTLHSLRSDVFQRSMVLQSMLVCAWLTAGPVIEKIRTAQEDAFVEETMQGNETAGGHDSGKEKVFSIEDVNQNQ